MPETMEYRIEYEPFFLIENGFFREKRLQKWQFKFQWHQINL